MNIKQKNKEIIYCGKLLTLAEVGYNKECISCKAKIDEKEYKKGKGLCKYCI